MCLCSHNTVLILLLFVGVPIRYYCKCGKKYLHKESLYKHRKYECGKDPQFCCPSCPYKAKHKASLKTHIFLKHGNLHIKENYF